MIGAPLVGAFVAHLAFWVLLALGFVFGDFGERGAAAFVGLPRIAWWTAPLVTSWVAVLDIVLVFTVLKRDIRLG